MYQVFSMAMMTHFRAKATAVVFCHFHKCRLFQFLTTNLIHPTFWPCTHRFVISVRAEGVTFKIYKVIFVFTLASTTWVYDFVTSSNWSGFGKNVQEEVKCGGRGVYLSI